MSFSSYSSPSELLAQLLAEGKHIIGELLLGHDFSLRHLKDSDIYESQLKLYEHPEAAREIARYDAKGNYRPLKTAPNLRRGWLLQLRNIEEMALALDFFYPAALSLYGAWLARIFHPSLLRKPGTPMATALVPAFAGMSSMHAYCSTLYSKPALPHQPSRLSRCESDEISGLAKKLEVTSLRETLGRQSGMYRVTQKLSDDQAQSLIGSFCCSNKGCLRKVLWKLDADNEVKTLPEEKRTGNSSYFEIPLLCREACNLLVAAARDVVKNEEIT